MPQLPPGRFPRYRPKGPRAHGRRLPNTVLATVLGVTTRTISRWKAAGLLDNTPAGLAAFLRMDTPWRRHTMSLSVPDKSGTSPDAR